MQIRYSSQYSQEINANVIKPIMLATAHTIKKTNKDDRTFSEQSEKSYCLQ